MTNFSRRAVQKLSKLSGEQINRVFTVLCDEDETFDAVLESLSTGLVVCNLDGSVRMLNKAAERYLPFSPMRNLGSRDSHAPVWELINDEDIAAFLKGCAEHQKNNVPEEFTVQPYGRLSALFISVRVMPLVRSGRVIGSIISVEDITEKHNQEILFRHMESLAGLTNLAASVAHEIKNPLGSISIHIQLIQKALAKARAGDGTLPDEKFAEKHLTVVNQEIDRLNTIITDFLFAVRPIKVQLEAVDPDALIAECLDFCRPELEKKQIQIKTAYSQPSVRLMLDAKLFRQALINLVQNAEAAMPDGGTLSVGTTVQNDRFVLIFTDTGIGMDSVTVSRIFEPYFTTKAAGTGLGLTMAYKVIRELAGDISVKSELGQGTAFTISFPLPQREKRLLEYRQGL